MKNKVFALFLTSGLLLTSCTSDASSTGDNDKKDVTEVTEVAEISEEFSGKLTVQIIGNYKYEDATDPLSGEKIKGIKTLEDEFERRYPGVDLEYILMGWDSYQQKTQTMLLGNEADVYQMPGIANFAEQGLLDPLAPYIEKDGLDLDKYINGQVEGWMAIGPDSDELEIFGLPMIGDSRVIVYDTLLFDQWGVEYLSKEPTIEELIEKASAMTGENPVTGEQNYGFYTRGKYAFDQTINFAEAHGGTWGEGYTLSTMKTNFDSPEMIQGLKDFIELSTYAPQGMLTDQGNELFLTKDNNIAFSYAMPPSYLPSLEALGLEDRYDIAYMMVNPDTGTGAVFSGSPVGISAESENKDLAWEYLKFTGSEFFQEFLLHEHNSIPVLKSAAQWDYVQNNPHTLGLLESMSRLWTPRYVYRSGQPRGILSSYVEKAYLGELTPEEALAGAQKDTMDWVATQQ